MKFAANDYESKVFKSTDFHLFAKEFLAINGNYIAHHYNTKFGNRDSIVPYDKVDFFIITKSGCCTKRLLLIGDLNFAAQGKFSNVSIAQVRKELLKMQQMNKVSTLKTVALGCFATQVINGIYRKRFGNKVFFSCAVFSGCRTFDIPPKTYMQYKIFRRYTRCCRYK